MYEGSMEYGEGDPRAIENGMSMPVSGLTADFVKVWLLTVATDRLGSEFHLVV